MARKTVLVKVIREKGFILFLPSEVVSVENNIMLHYFFKKSPLTSCFSNHADRADLQFRGISYDTAVKIAPLVADNRSN